jgi:hypothetical protein
VIEIKKVSAMKFNNIESFKTKVILQTRFMKASRNVVALLSLFCLVLLSSCSQTAVATTDSTYVFTERRSGRFILTEAGNSAPLLVNSQDFPGVIRVAKHLQTDIGKVTDVLPILSIDTIPDANEIILIGTKGKSPLIDRLVKENKMGMFTDSGLKKSTAQR